MRAVIVICLALRLALFLAAKPWMAPVRDHILLRADGKEYHEIALSLLSRSDFSAGEEFKGLRTPAYPFFVTAIYSIAGPRPWVVLLFQAFLDTFSCWLLFLLLKRHFGQRPAMLASLFYAADPTLIYYTSTLFSDTFFVFMIMVFFFYFSRLFKEEQDGRQTRYIILSAIAFGLATLTKPVTYYLALLTPAAFLLLHRWSWASIRLSAAFLTVFFLTLTPWMTRNYFRFHHFALSNSGDYNTLAVYVSHTEMERRHSQDLYYTVNQLFSEGDSLIRQAGYDPATINPFEKAAYYRKLAINYIEKYPALFGKHILLGASHQIFGLGTQGYSDILPLGQSPETFTVFAHSNFYDLLDSFLHKKPWQEIVLGCLIAAYLAVVYSCALYGVFLTFRSHKYFSLFCMLTIAYLIIVPGPGGWIRYKLPAIPFYLGFAGTGLNYLLARRLKSNFSFL